jgi:hypothetical protein
MQDRELNRIEFEMNNFEEHFQYMPQENYGKPVYKRYGALNALEAQFDDDFENLEEHFKKGKLKKLGKKIGDKIKKVADKVSPKEAVFLPLVPFKGLLKKRLKKKGITPKSNKIKDIVFAFYDAEVKTGSFEETTGNLVDDAIGIVKEVLDLIKKISDKVKAGKGNADDEEFAADADSAANEADDISEKMLQDELSTDDKNQASSTGAGMGLSTNTILILVAAVVAVYFFSKKS